MRDFYRDSNTAREDRALAVLLYKEFANQHRTMTEALDPAVREWLDENVRGDLEWDIWDRDKMSANTDFALNENGGRGHRKLDSYFFVFQFESETEAAMFKLRWPVALSRPIVA